jgi:hypothetical protein
MSAHAQEAGGGAFGAATKPRRDPVVTLLAVT